MEIVWYSPPTSVSCPTHCHCSSLSVKMGWPRRSVKEVPLMPSGSESTECVRFTL